MNKQLQELILSYKDDILSDLKNLVAINSVAQFTDTEGAPFGENAKKALDYILGRGEEMGFKVKNIGGAAGHVELGEGDTYAGVLSHVDVVPAGEGWDTDPFTLTIKDGKIFGRGVADDKGASIISLYCLKALKELGVKGNRRIRCIYGAGEEIGMDDMQTYFEAEPLPEAAFTPDSGYPVCNREKGILHFELKGALSPDSRLVFMHSGTAINCVAERTEAQIKNDISNDIIEKIKASGCECSAENGKISAKGKSAHAMCPQEGINSAAAALNALNGEFNEQWLSDVCALACSGTDGAGFGVDCSDEPSGALTINLGAAHIENGAFTLGLDIRYPVTKNGAEIIEKLKAAAAQKGFSINVLGDNAPIYMPDDDPLIRLLCEVYADVTGKKGETYSTGGGTYARALQNRGVAFGLEVDGHPTHLHEANEHLYMEDFLSHMCICCEAMYRLYTM